MRSRLRRLTAVTTTALLGASAAFACADQGEEPIVTPVPSEGGVLVVDAAPVDAYVPPALDASPPRCTDAGWCVTALPDSRLSMSAIEPHPTRAFALASSEALGLRALEWDGKAWDYIDDGTQNLLDVAWASLWAPTDNDILFSVVDIGDILTGRTATHLFRGARPAPGAAPTWSQTTFPSCEGYAFSGALGGSSVNDAFVAHCAKVYRTTGGAADAGDGGPPSGWSVAWTDPDLETPVTFFRITSAGPNDVWIMGQRSNACVVVLHQTAQGIRAVVDGKANNTGVGAPCLAKAGAARVESAFMGGFAPAANTLVLSVQELQPGTGYFVSSKLVRITDTGSGMPTVDQVTVPADVTVKFGPTWGTSPNDLFVIGSSFAVMRASSVFTDAGTYEFSTLVRNGAPNTQQLSAISGTAIDNLWLVGNDVAYHKTTP